MAAKLGEDDENQPMNEMTWFSSNQIAAAKQEHVRKMGESLRIAKCGSATGEKSHAFPNNETYHTKKSSCPPPHDQLRLSLKTATTTTRHQQIEMPISDNY